MSQSVASFLADTSRALSTLKVRAVCHCIGVFGDAVTSFISRQSKSTGSPERTMTMSKQIDHSWDRYRTYLRFIVESRVPPHLKQHVDLSGVVQQTLLEAHQAVQERQATVTLPLLRQILVNNFTDEMRRLKADKRDVRRVRSISSEIEQSSMQLEKILQDGTPLPIDLLAQQELALRLTEALEKLPESQREALVLQAWQGWSLAEIAEQMGRSTMAVAGLLKRGLRQLRQDMEAIDGSSASASDPN